MFNGEFECITTVILHFNSRCREMRRSGRHVLPVLEELAPLIPRGSTVHTKNTLHRYYHIAVTGDEAQDLDDDVWPAADVGSVVVEDRDTLAGESLCVFEGVLFNG